uniref:SAP30-binding protein n=1 Tax=Glossina brevipalpis TaxID=37001 RepID=A0A1A9X3P7_9MUSC
MSKALATLTAQYTDSENEEDHQHSPDSQNSQASQVIIPPIKYTPQPSPENKTKGNFDQEVKKSRKKSRKSLKRLVSYHDDTIITDDESAEEEIERDDDISSQSSVDSNNENHSKSFDKSEIRCSEESPTQICDDNEDHSVHLQKEGTSCIIAPDMVSKSDKYAKYAHYGFSLPPEPKSKPLPELTEKVKQLYDKMETNNMDMNCVIQQRKEFRNPSIYEKLIQFCDINEFGTNYPPEVYDPLRWGPESYYEELDRVQRLEMTKRQKERKDKDKIEQVSALARKVEEEAKKRKSKWDQPAAKPTVPPTLTTTVTGTKGTVISAFGSLKPSA